MAEKTTYPHTNRPPKKFTQKVCTAGPGAAF